MSKHTPGPWTATNADHICGPDEHFLALPPYWFIDGGRGYAKDGFRIAAFMKEGDARLIAAAPELLEALKTLISRGYDADFCDGLCDAVIDCKWCAARKAIAKAEGQ